ncbi:HAMP domain-containing histidine kinase, partial [Candidatus Parcubacteria bacterium]|nr:HAMP domain-containing histidine kinase [Candidatus Parcubacteria bacterium]
IIRSVKKETALNDRLEKTNIQLKELDEKKTEFMSLATHQLRTPLTAMKGYSSMILDGTFGKEQNPEIEDAINKISRSTTDLTMIVEDYLNISMIEQGRMQYNFVTCDVAKIIKSIVADMKNTAERLGLVVNLEFDTNTTFPVNVDEGKIRQVFINVIDNAIKYTPKGHIDISIIRTLENKALVKIQDTGVGIHEDVLPTLFNKYVRAPDASRVNILGTGLGLYVAGEILKAHDGKAWAESHGEGKGSVFYIQLDLA